MSDKQRYFIRFCYSGKSYHGWQLQPNAITVQEVMEKALSTLIKENITLTAAGRTDTGVHAREMYAHFDTATLQDPQHLTYRLNQFLPSDIAVFEILKVKKDAHARFDACSRSYEYLISLSKNPFYEDFAHFSYHQPKVILMNTACEYLKGEKDFECFSKTHTDVNTFICNITEAHWKPEGDLLTFHITANRFLRNMVRAIVGTLVEIGLEKRSVESLPLLLASKNRSKAGVSVPAKGLYLTRVVYPKELFL